MRLAPVTAGAVSLYPGRIIRVAVVGGHRSGALT
jgi:hypothetical protein